MRYKPVAKPAKGTRKCKCRTETKTRSAGFGQFQMYQEEVCEKCKAVKLVLCSVCCHLIFVFSSFMQCQYVLQ